MKMLSALRGQALSQSGNWEPRSPMPTPQGQRGPRGRTGTVKQIQRKRGREREKKDNFLRLS